ncbi:hypothetical protein GCM10011400_61070 [Paraburkholderia caffeinilytica]|uniref:Uncharacterized protein n=1 Tax=Paraburkholderia caffeinilytica TaxID=1761016 RepID=A0ABQ1NAD5_9BURK|nr:hypothetical protein GCM10011400_61070 [Paraburkholderia caffeinilytica]
MRPEEKGYQSRRNDGSKTIGFGSARKPLVNRANKHYPKESADEFAIRWLEAIDRGDYRGAYIGLYPIANATMSEGQFISAMKEARRRVGPTRGRT